MLSSLKSQKILDHGPKVRVLFSEPLFLCSYLLDFILRRHGSHTDTRATVELEKTQKRVDSPQSIGEEIVETITALPPAILPL
jgi:hypothetical protein